MGKRKRKKIRSPPVSILLGYSGILLFLFSGFKIIRLIDLAIKLGTNLMELVYIPLIEATIFLVLGFALAMHGLSSKL
ncbi:MAG: hypothetical protein QGI21_00590 [Candidatus Poseidoniaceae archaeon]|jgi:hypothetical protein|nr:hypothetical protein [Candidatus Poseidoniaceae archaeon]